MKVNNRYFKVNEKHISIWDILKDGGRNNE